MGAPSHEQPMYVLLPASLPPGEVVARLLADPAVRHLAFPPLWFLDRCGIDLPAALPACRALTPETLAEAIGALLRLCDGPRLDALVARTWREVDEPVRQHYLDLGVARAFATALRLAPRSHNVDAPPAFRRDRIHENGLSIDYRLAGRGERDMRAPPEEGSVVLYPFDPANAAGRSEAGLPQGTEPVIEVFAYETGRDLHCEHWQSAAARVGARFHDPRTAR